MGTQIGCLDLLQRNTKRKSTTQRSDTHTHTSVITSPHHTRLLPPVPNRDLLRGVTSPFNASFSAPPPPLHLPHWESLAQAQSLSFPVTKTIDSIAPTSIAQYVYLQQTDHCHGASSSSGPLHWCRCWYGLSSCLYH